MKKMSKKLALKREALKTLSNELRSAAGGNEGDLFAVQDPNIYGTGAAGGSRRTSFA